MSHHTRGRKTPAGVPVDALKRVPAAPAILSTEGKREWRRVMPVLIDRGVLSPADLTAAETYCAAVGDAAQARAAMKRDGDYMPNAKGELKRHPAWTTLREATTAARQWAAELGLLELFRIRSHVDHRHRRHGLQTWHQFQQEAGNRFRGLAKGVGIIRLVSENTRIGDASRVEPTTAAFAKEASVHGLAEYGRPRTPQRQDAAQHRRQGFGRLGAVNRRHG